MCKILFSVFCVSMAANAASMMGLEALGKPTEGTTAITLGRGYSGGAKAGSDYVEWNFPNTIFRNSKRF